MTKHAEWSSRFQFSVEKSRTRFARGRAGLAGAAGGGLALLAVTAALAISVLLPPRGVVHPVPATTAAMEPSLVGVVIHKPPPPVLFTIKAPTGAVLCQGQLQDLVVRSGQTGLFDFYYRVLNTSGTGAVDRIDTYGFGGVALRVAFRADGPGTVRPSEATRSAAPGVVVDFLLNDPPISCAQHQESRFMLIKTNARAFKAGGQTQIFATTGVHVSVPTVMP